MTASVTSIHLYGMEKKCIISQWSRLSVPKIIVLCSRKRTHVVWKASIIFIWVRCRFKKPINSNVGCLLELRPWMCLINGCFFIMNSFNLSCDHVSVHVVYLCHESQYISVKVNSNPHFYSSFILLEAYPKRLSWYVYSFAVISTRCLEYSHPYS